MIFLKQLVVAVSLAGVGTMAAAQSWPVKPIRWISPFAPGGGADITSRIIA